MECGHVQEAGPLRDAQLCQGLQRRALGARVRKRGSSVEIKDSVVLVTGGNRGLGKCLVQSFLEAGAQKVYVGSRRPVELNDARLQAVNLDITDARDIAAAAEA